MRCPATITPRSAYLDGAGLRDDPKGPLFRTIGRGTGLLTRAVAFAGQRLRDDPPALGMRPARHSSTIAGAMT